MKKLIYIFVALLAFAVGMFVFFLRPLFITVPLYDLRNNVEYYKSYKIKVKGIFLVIKSPSRSYYFLVDEDADCVVVDFDCRKHMLLELSQETERNALSLINEIVEKNDQIGKTDFSAGEYGAEVELIGYVDERQLNPHVDNGYAPIIIAEEIKQIAPIQLIKARPITAK